MNSYFNIRNVTVTCSLILMSCNGAFIVIMPLLRIVMVITVCFCYSMVQFTAEVDQMWDA